MERVFVITNPIPASNLSPVVTLTKFLNMVSEVSKRVVVIGGNLCDTIATDLPKTKFQVWTTRYYPHSCSLLKVISFFRMQMVLSVRLLRSLQKNDTVFFWIGDKMLLPFIVAKVKSAQINYFVMGNIEKEGTASLSKAVSAKLIRIMARNADYICAESKSVLGAWSLQTEKSRFIHLYTDYSLCQRSFHRNNTVGMICRLADGKHVLEAIEGFYKFAHGHPGWTLEIVGSGRLYRECAELIATLGATHIIKLLGWINHEALPTTVANWRVLLFPSDAEGLPNGLIEAMALGVPAIVSPVGGICDVVDDGETGWYLDDTSADSIARAIEDAINDPNLTLIAKKAEERIRSNFTFERSVRNLRDQLK